MPLNANHILGTLYARMPGKHSPALTIAAVLHKVFSIAFIAMKGISSVPFMLPESRRLVQAGT